MLNKLCSNSTKEKYLCCVKMRLRNAILKILHAFLKPGCINCLVLYFSSRNTYDCKTFHNSQNMII